MWICARRWYIILRTWKLFNFFHQTKIIFRIFIHFWRMEKTARDTQNYYTVVLSLKYSAKWKKFPKNSSIITPSDLSSFHQTSTWYFVIVIFYMVILPLQFINRNVYKYWRLQPRSRNYKVVSFPLPKQISKQPSNFSRNPESGELAVFQQFQNFKLHKQLFHISQPALSPSSRKRLDRDKGWGPDSRFPSSKERERERERERKREREEKTF